MPAGLRSASSVSPAAGSRTPSLPSACRRLYVSRGSCLAARASPGRRAASAPDGPAGHAEVRPASRDATPVIGWGGARTATPPSSALDRVNSPAAGARVAPRHSLAEECLAARGPAEALMLQGRSLPGIVGAIRTRPYVAVVIAGVAGSGRVQPALGVIALLANSARVETCEVWPTPREPTPTG